MTRCGEAGVIGFKQKEAVGPFLSHQWSDGPEQYG